jgi:hypothetical protein
MPRNTLDLDPLIKQFQQEKRTLPAKLGNQAVRLFQNNFDKEGFKDQTIDPWKRRKYTPRGGPKKILTVTGKLRRSVKRIRTSFNRIEIGTKGVIYAARHNHGLDGMKQRKFIGESKFVERVLKKRIEKEISNFAQNL